MIDPLEFEGIPVDPTLRLVWVVLLSTGWDKVSIKKYVPKVMIQIEGTRGDNITNYCHEIDLTWAYKQVDIGEVIELIEKLKKP